MMVTTRETRAHAAEIKFVIDGSLARCIREWARIHLQADPHGTGPCGDEYDTTSIYFDTRQFDVLHRRRSFARAKYRVRRYGAADTLYLERKLRKPGVLIKRRTLAPLSFLERLDTTDDGADWAGAWFHRRLIARELRPVCQVSYRRMARFIDLPEGQARLTLDSHPRASSLAEARFSDGPVVPFLGDDMILELKYRGKLPAVFRRLVEDFALSAATASKYRLGMAAVGHVAMDDAWARGRFHA